MLLLIFNFFLKMTNIQEFGTRKNGFFKISKLSLRDRQYNKLVKSPDSRSRLLESKSCFCHGPTGVGSSGQMTKHHCASVSSFVE